MAPALDLQLELELPEVYRHRLLMDRKLDAARKLCAERTIKAVAHQLDQIWGPLGHPVSASTLGNALGDRERNYWRSEWDSWFCDACEEFRDVCAELVGRGKPKKKTHDEIIEDYRRLTRAKLSQREAEKMIREAEGR